MERFARTFFGLAILSLSGLQMGCGLLLQTIVGWHDETTERRTEPHSIVINSVPPGAEIVRRDPLGLEMPIGPAPLRDRVSYEVDVTVESPSVSGLLIGGLLLDLGGGIAMTAAAVAAQGESVMGAVGAWGVASVIFGTPVDLLTALIYGVTGDDEVTKRVAVPETQDYAYTAKLGGAPSVARSVRVPDEGRLDLFVDPRAIPPEVLAAGEPSVAAAAPGQTVVGPGRAGMDHRWVVAVMDVEDLNSEDADQKLDRRLVRSLGDQLRIFVARQGVPTIDRGAQDKMLRDQIARMKTESFKACYDDSCQIELGKALAASHILRSKITRFGSLCVLNAELVDLAAEVTMAAASARGDCEAEGLLTMSESVAGELVARP